MRFINSRVIVTGLVCVFSLMAFTFGIFPRYDHEAVGQRKWCLERLPVGWEVVDIGTSMPDDPDNRRIRTRLEIKASIDILGLVGNGKKYNQQKYLLLVIFERFGNDLRTATSNRNSLERVLGLESRDLLRRVPERDFLDFEAYESTLGKGAWINYIRREGAVSCRQLREIEHPSGWPNPFLNCGYSAQHFDISFKVPEASKLSVNRIIKLISEVSNNLPCNYN